MLVHALPFGTESLLLDFKSTLKNLGHFLSLRDDVIGDMIGERAELEDISKLMNTNVCSITSHLLLDPNTELIVRLPSFAIRQAFLAGYREPIALQLLAGR